MTKTRGRPRRNPTSPTGLGTDKDILYAAGELFVRQGFGQTSTRAIAEAAGLQQASVYHWFGSKDEILLRLVLGTVLPSRRIAERLLTEVKPGHVRLWALTYADTSLLVSDPQNLGALYFAPELGGDQFEEFHRNRDALIDIYRTLLEQSTGRDLSPFEGAMAVGLVENVIMHRQRSTLVLPVDAPIQIADASLVLAGVPHLATEDTRRQSLAVLASLTPPSVPGDVCG